MKLDPVFIIAPKPKPPSMPTRRAFVLAGATFALGAAAGGACGYSLGAAANAQPEEEELAPSGDAELDELRRLAIKAPISELVQHRLMYLNSLSRYYRKDEVLWRGFERLCDVVMQDAAFPERRLSARLLAQMIEYAEPEYKERFAVRAQDLRAVR